MVKARIPLVEIEQELRQAMNAKKCWRCGCFQDTVNTLKASDTISSTLGAQLENGII